MSYNGTYECKDGKTIAIGCVETKFWEKLCQSIGKEELIPNQFAESKEQQDEMKAQLSSVFRTQSQSYWFDLLSKKGLPVSKMNRLSEVFQDPQIVQRQMVIEVEHPSLGKVKQVGIAIKLLGTPGSAKGAIPTVGQHTTGVLQQLGYSDTQIQELQKIGAVYG
jgi:crotonobetainyl-CoA:carnitine CoA-transferase CaiB-like acyl-CoA transferase